MAHPDNSSDPLPTQPWTGPAPSEVPPAPAAPPRPGGWQPPEPEQLQASFPQYEIQAVLGRGGMGAVYKGWQKSLKRFVAIKILPPGLQDKGANFAERFQREAQAMARFSHPGIVSVHDAGQTADGLLYFIMEYIEGTDVEQMVRENGPLPPEHALAITVHVCDALAYAHQRGVIHRDIKPSNIMVDRDGAVKVADFGLAKLATDDGAALSTSSHVRMGTPDFMAPEALHGGMAHVDHRADLYAVGVMLYQMLTGEVPRGLFEMPSVHRPGLDPRFDAIVVRAMQKNPDKRYASATEIRADLKQIFIEPASPALTAPSTGSKATRGADATSPVTGHLVPWLGEGEPAHERNRGGAGRSLAALGVIALIASGAVYFLVKFRPDLMPKVGHHASLTTPHPIPEPPPSAVSPTAATLPGSAPAIPAPPAEMPATPAPTIPPPLATPAPMPVASIPSTPAPTIPVPVTPAPAAAPQVPSQWFPMLQSAAELVRANRQQGLGLAWRDNWVKPISAPIEWSSSLTGLNGGIRARFRHEEPQSSLVPASMRLIGQVLLGGSDGGAYGLRLRDERTALLFRNSSGQRNFEELKIASLPQPVTPGTEYTLELARVGNQLSARCNEIELATLEETRLRAPGSVGVFSYLPIRDLEILRFGNFQSLTAKASTSTSPLQASREKPFTNSLGMKFVPVPGTKVLFSIWETRVRDYRQYARSRKNVDPLWSRAVAVESIPAGRGDNDPVIAVNWHEARDFCLWLTKYDPPPSGMKYRLPTDLEWSLAISLTGESGSTPAERARKTPESFPWRGGWPPKDGTGNYQDTAWHREVPDKPWIPDYTDGFVTTAPVGSFAPNAFGIYDLSGNAWEWCEDYFDVASGLLSLRGGSYDASTRADLSAARRIGYPAHYRLPGFGFRVVLAPLAADQ